MGLIRPFPDEKLIAGIILNPRRTDWTAVKNRLCKMFGETDLESGPIDFRHTNYYNDEMGEGLVKYLISFHSLIQPQDISQVKIHTNETEISCFSEQGRRFVNIDPGLLNATRFMLVTTKNYAHRIPLQDGIYAELTLVYHKKNWEFLDWTYPDFRTNEYLNFFTRVRSILLEQIKQRNEHDN